MTTVPTEPGAKVTVDVPAVSVPDVTTAVPEVAVPVIVPLRATVKVKAVVGIMVTVPEEPAARVTVLATPAARAPPAATVAPAEAAVPAIPAGVVTMKVKGVVKTMFTVPTELTFNVTRVVAPAFRVTGAGRVAVPEVAVPAIPAGIVTLKAKAVVRVKVTAPAAVWGTVVVAPAGRGVGFVVKPAPAAEPAMPAGIVTVKLVAAVVVITWLGAVSVTGVAGILAPATVTTGIPTVTVWVAAVNTPAPAVTVPTELTTLEPAGMPIVTTWPGVVIVIVGVAPVVVTVIVVVVAAGRATVPPVMTVVPVWVIEPAIPAGIVTVKVPVVRAVRVWTGDVRVNVPPEMTVPPVTVIVGIAGVVAVPVAVLATARTGAPTVMVWGLVASETGEPVTEAPVTVPVATPPPTSAPPVMARAPEAFISPTSDQVKPPTWNISTLLMAPAPPFTLMRNVKALVEK
jgi:hypothetical protein